MNCPVCGHEGAEVGLSKVYCPSRDCKHYDAEQAIKHRSTAITATMPAAEDNTETYYHDVFLGPTQAHAIVNGIVSGSSKVNALPPPKDGSIYISIDGESFMFSNGDWYRL